MAIFKSDPMKTLRRDIDAAKANRDRLSAKLAETEAAIIERRSAAQALARDGADDGVLEKAEAAIRGAQDRASTIAGAVADVVQQLAALEATQIENSDRKLRTETAAEVAAMAVDLEQAAASYDIAVAALSDVAGRAAMFIPDAMGLEAFAASSRQQVPPAVELIAMLMRDHAAAVLKGSAAATLRKAEPVVVPAPAPVLTRVWVTKPIAFKNGSLVEIRDSNCWVDLDPLLATKAINDSVAVPLGHARAGKIAQTWKQVYGYGLPSLDACHPLDDAAKAAGAKGTENKLRPEEQPEQVTHSAFVPVDRGRPFIVKTPAGNPTPGEAA